MCVYKVNGLECNFPGIPWTIIDDYKPTPHTYLYAFKALEPWGGLFLINLVDTLTRMNCIQRTKFILLEGNREAILFDFVGLATTYTINAIDRYSSTLCGPSHYLLICPHHKAEYANAAGNVEIINQGYRSAAYSEKIHGTKPIPKEHPAIVSMESQLEKAAQDMETHRGRYPNDPTTETQNTDNYDTTR